MAIFRPRASRIAANDAEAMPFPKEETTPPVTFPPECDEHEPLPTDVGYHNAAALFMASAAGALVVIAVIVCVDRRVHSRVLELAGLPTSLFVSPLAADVATRSRIVAAREAVRAEALQQWTGETEGLASPRESMEMTTYAGREVAAEGVGRSSSSLWRGAGTRDSHGSVTILEYEDPDAPHSSSSFRRGRVVADLNDEMVAV